MPICQACQQEKTRVFKCGRCRSAEYCSKDCQRSAWRDHKPNCAGQGSQTTVPNKTQMAILLGEGFRAKSVQIPQTTLIPLIRQQFNQHKSSSDEDFIDVLMPVSDRLFGRPMRIVYDKGCANNRQPNTFATRDACSLQTGLGPNISGQVSKQQGIKAPATSMWLCQQLECVVSSSVRTAHYMNISCLPPIP